MKYEVRLGDRAFEVEVDGDRVRVGGREFRAALVRTGQDPLHRLVTEHGARVFAVIREGGGWRIHAGGWTWEAEVLDERARHLRRMAGQGKVKSTDAVVRAPMPGLVLRLEVQEGQPVAAGGGVVVLEAMKMENEIRSPGSGVVRRVLVRPGQVVEKGAPLVEIAAE